jgi:TolB protein
MFTAHRACLLAGTALLACAAPSAEAEPVNGRIAFTTFESSADPAAGDIWTMSADGADKRQAVFDPGYDAQSDWSPDGTRIVFRSRHNNQYEVSIADFSVLDPATGRPRVVELPKAPDGTQSSQPAWFPDGSALLYRRTNGPETTRSDIWAMNLDGSNRHPVAVLAQDQFYPSFSQDRSKLLFATVAPPSGRSIQVMDVATGAVTTLFDYTAQSFESAPAWSPDGRQIAFESNLDGDMEIFVMNADGSGVRQLTHNTLWDEGPAWSPDGTRFAFSRGTDDLHLDIWTMNADGSDARQLTTYPGRDESPDWGANPVSNAQVEVQFLQSVGACEPLRTGTHAKTLTSRCRRRSRDAQDRPVHRMLVPGRDLHPRSLRYVGLLGAGRELEIALERPVGRERVERPRCRHAVETFDADRLDVCQYADTVADLRLREGAAAVGGWVVLVVDDLDAVPQPAQVGREVAPRGVEVEVAHLHFTRVAEAVHDPRRDPRQRTGWHCQLVIFRPEADGDLTREHVEQIAVLVVDVEVRSFLPWRQTRDGGVKRRLVGEDLDPAGGGVADDVAVTSADNR